MNTIATDMNNEIRVAQSEHETANDRHFGEALSWETSQVLEAYRSKRRAWFAASGLGLLLGLSVVSNVVMMPLKTVEPFVVRVDETTGVVDIAARVEDMTISGEDVMTKYWLSKYVIHRETYNYQLLQTDYDTVGLMSSESVGSEYGAQFIGDDALDKRYADRIVADVKILSVVPTSERTGTIRFTKTTGLRKDTTRKPEVTHWIATVAFEYRNASRMTEEVQLVNPVGFQVVSYRVDPESAGAGL